MSDSFPSWSLMVIGAHMSGFPLNEQLVNLSAQHVANVRTAARYSLYDLGGSPPKPGMVRMVSGYTVQGEVWSLPLQNVGRFLETVQSPLCIGSIMLDDGTMTHGFLCESVAVQDAHDISEIGCWRTWCRMNQ